MRAVSEYLKTCDITILNTDYKEAVSTAKKGDFIYLDPPYAPSSPTANFTKYTKDGFGPDDQEELAEVFRHLDRKGCKVMLSNSNTGL
ncbi:MAG: DNA adenine methylase [Aquificota bacterium]|nr:DNA adenine methylase [Aquificota bacterium]